MRVPLKSVWAEIAITFGALATIILLGGGKSSYLDRTIQATVLNGFGNMSGLNRAGIR